MNLPELCLRKKRMYSVLKQGDYNMKSAYGIFGVCFISFMVCLYGSFVCFLVRGKETQLSF